MFLNKKELFAALLVPIVFFLYALYTIGDYGINWDEPYHFRRGQAFLQFYLTGKKTYEGMPKYPPLKGTADDPTFRNSQALFEEVQKNPSLSDPNFRRSYYQDDVWNGEYHIDMETPSGHPALNGVLAASFNKIFYQKLGILGDLESYHLFEITAASVLVFGVAIFMWKEFGVLESVVSSLALATYPLFLGEAHFNIKDPVETAFYIVTLLAAFKATTKKSPFWLLTSAFFFAFALSTKFNILFILFPLVLWAIIYLLQNKGHLKFNRKFYLSALIAPFLIISLFVLFFPPLWKNPIGGTMSVISYYLKVGYSSNQSTSINLNPVFWILYTTPIITLVSFFSAFISPKKLLSHKMFPLLLVLTLFVTISRVTLPGTTNYGGVRQIMEYIPTMAMLAGIGTGQIMQILKIKYQNHISKSLKYFNIFELSFCILIFAFLFSPIWRLHPHENVYFNSLIGGLSGAKEKGLEAWGNSYGNAYFPAIDWLNNHAEENTKLTLPVGSISNIPRYKLRKDIALSADYWSGPAHDGEYVLELTYDYEPMKWFSLNYLNTAMRPVYEVTVDGVTIAKLWKNSPENVLPQFQKEKLTTAKVSRTEEYLEIILPTNEKITQVTLSQPIENCSAVTTGYLDTSLNGQDWTRETEDIARDQLKHAEMKVLEKNYTFYLVAVKGKYLRFHPENLNACILKAKDAVVTTL